MSSLASQLKQCVRVMALSIVLTLSACGGGGGGGAAPPAAGGGGSTPPPPPPASQTLGESGGVLDFGGVTISSQQGLLIGDVEITVTDVETPPAVPSGFVVVGTAIDIDLGTDRGELVNGPLSVSMSYDDSQIDDEEDLLVLHYDERTATYQAVRITSLDTQNNTIDFESRSFSIFVAVDVASNLVLPGALSTGFVPAVDGWSIDNPGTFFAPGGSCLGMSGYAVWFFSSGVSGSLSTKYSPDIAKIAVIRAHLAQSQSWTRSHWLSQQLLLPESAIGRAMKTYLALTGKPLILTLGTNGRIGHASVVYAYDETNFYFYDVNLPGVEQQVSFNGTAFGTYDANGRYSTAFDTFGFVGLPSLGRTEDFAGLAAEADQGFTTSSDIQLQFPTPDQQIAAHSTELQGTLSGSLDSAAQLLAQIKGIEQIIPVNAGVFDKTIPVSSGGNTIVLIAGSNNVRRTFNWYKNSAALIRDFEGTLSASTMVVTLTWDQDDTDVDLYVTDPANETSWYSSRATASGLILDFDDTSGFGPEHTTLSADSGTVLPDLYEIGVHYFSDHSTGQAVTGEVTIVLYEGEDRQQVKQFPFSIATSDSTADGPGGSGSSRLLIALVDVEVGEIQGEF